MGNEKYPFDRPTYTAITKYYSNWVFAKHTMSLFVALPTFILGFMESCLLFCSGCSGMMKSDEWRLLFFQQKWGLRRLLWSVNILSRNWWRTRCKANHCKLLHPMCWFHIPRLTWQGDEASSSKIDSNIPTSCDSWDHRDSPSLRISSYFCPCPCDPPL